MIEPDRKSEVVFQQKYRDVMGQLLGGVSASHGLSHAAIDEAEIRLGFRLPVALRSFYSDRAIRLAGVRL